MNVELPPVPGGKRTTGRSAPNFLLASPGASLERRRLQSYLALLVGDIAMLFCAFVLGGWAYLGSYGVHMGLVLAQLVLPVFLTVALYDNAYSLRALQDWRYGSARALIALAISSAAVVFIAFYTKSSHDFSRVSFTLGIALAALLLPWLRVQMRWFVIWRCGARVLHQLVIHDGGPSIDLPGASTIEAGRFNLVPDPADPVALDRIGSVLRGCDRVVVSCPPERRHAWALILKSAAIAGEVIDDTIAELDALGARRAGGRGLLLVSVGPLGLRSRVTKRGFDILLSGLALLVLAPLMVVVALRIRGEDGGPALFVQRRIGRGNTFFKMYKFRSMRIGGLDQAGVVSTRRDDDRVTRIGAFIRRTSIDELPQLFNVLLGNMSIVGPRPHALGSQAGDKLFWEVDTRYWLRHALKPGLTGLAQVRGYRGATDHESDLEARLGADLEYLNGWSIWRDVAIVFATARVIVHDRAY